MIKTPIILEFFSGIGGLRAAYQRTKCQQASFYPFDINHIANTIYTSNYGDNVIAKTLDSITVETIEQIQGDAWFMSPPCQPYNNSIMSKHKDINDARAKSVLHLYNDILPNLKKKPEHIFIENVPLFKESLVFKEILKVLNQLNYFIEYTTLSPHQIGIPNSRTRFYVMARLNPFTFQFQPQQNQLLPLSSFLDSNVNESFNVKPELIAKKGMLFDIVGKEDTHSCCFTKSYSKVVEGTGSILTQEFNTFQSVDTIDKLLTLRIHGFPSNFSTQINNVTIRQQYQCLGNSVSCYVIAPLMEHLFDDN
ncbi:Methyltransferase [Entamoeba marina]